MKKIIMTLVFFFLLVGGIGVHAQDKSTDGFFHTNYELYRDDSDWGTMPLLPRTHGYEYDYDAEDPTPVPIGSGLLLLGVMSLGYLRTKNKD